jgi:hypothetical protein
MKVAFGNRDDGHNVSAGRSKASRTRARLPTMSLSLLDLLDG